MLRITATTVNLKEWHALLSESRLDSAFGHKPTPDWLQNIFPMQNCERGLKESGAAMAANKLGTCSASLLRPLKAFPKDCIDCYCLAPDPMTPDPDSDEQSHAENPTAAEAREPRREVSTTVSALLDAAGQQS